MSKGYQRVGYGAEAFAQAPRTESRFIRSDTPFQVTKNARGEPARQRRGHLPASGKSPIRTGAQDVYKRQGMDGLLDCFHFDCLPREELLARHRFRPAPGAEEPWRKRLITPEQTPRFYMDEVELRREAHGSALCVNRGFQVLLVLEGEAEFQWEGGSLRARRGEELFVPHGVASYQCTAEGTCRLLECGLPGV